MTRFALAAGVLRRALPRTAPLTLVALGLSSIILSAGCRPSDETTRQGYLNEFCTRDEQCREPFICENNVCVDESVPGGISCTEICDRFVTECGRNDDGCAASCRATIEEWSAEAVEIFGLCSLGMTTPALTCEEAKSDNAPSFCYQQIPLAQERRDRCDAFVEDASSYAVSPSESQLVSLRQQCYIIARTRSAEDWSATDACDERVDPLLTPRQVITCFNTVFEDLSPKLSAPAN